MPKMDYLNAYCRLITTGEEAEQFKSRVEIWETEIAVDKTSEKGNRQQVIYSNVPVKQQNIFSNKMWKVGRESEDLAHIVYQTIAY